MSNKKVRLVPPGYFACRMIINVLKRFRDLVLYYIPFVGYDEQASKTLEELLSKNIQETSRKHAVLKENIDKLIPTVKKYFSRAGIETRILSQGYEAGSLKIVEREYDLILEIFQLPYRLDANIYDMVISSIDRGIGFYESLKKKALLGLFSPISWIAYIFRLPLLIIQRAGLVTDEKEASQILKFYVWVMRLIILLILILIAKKLGVEDLFSSALRYL